MKEHLEKIRKAAHDAMWYAQPDGSNQKEAYNSITDLLNQPETVVVKEKTKAKKGK